MNFRIFVSISILLLSIVFLCEIISWHVTGIMFKFQFQWSNYQNLNEKFHEKPQKIEWCSKLRYLNSTDGFVTGLVSFPGSGNTWMRYLLQQATGF